MQLAIAYAGLGQKEQAVHHLNMMIERGGGRVNLIQDLGLINDRYDVFHGIENDVSFKDVIHRMQEQAKQTASMLRAQVPAAFPPPDWVPQS